MAKHLCFSVATGIEMSPYKTTATLLFLFAVVNSQNKIGSTEHYSDGLPTATINTFKKEEKEILTSVNSILRRIFPYVIENAQYVSISQRCASAMTKTFVDLRKLKGWTLELLDSIGKPTSGVLRGTSYTMGDYDQCLDITVTKSVQGNNADTILFTGKYCHILAQASETMYSTSKGYKTGKVNGSELGRMKEAIDAIPFVPMMPKYMSHLYGFCMPSVCSEDDVTKLFSALPFSGNLSVTRCEVKQEMKIDYQQRIVVGLFASLFLLVIAGTLTDVLLRYSTRNTALKQSKGKLLSLLVSFSFYSNVQRFARENKDSKSSPGSCFRGFVTGSILCIIFSNTYFLPHEVFYRQAGNLKNLEYYLAEVTFAINVCLSLAVETLFLSIGFFISCNCSSESDEIKERTCFNVLKMALYYYVRMCVPLLFCIGVLFLLPLLGSGPLWHDLIDDNIAQCRTGWWTYLAMYGNFESIHKQCFPHLWLVPCLIQTAVAGSLIVCFCSRCFRFGLSLLITAMLGCAIAVGWLTYAYNLPPSYLPYFAGNVSDQFWKVSFSSPLSHFSSCGIGIILGLLLMKKPNLTIRPVFLLLGWIVSLGLLGSVIFLLFPLRDEADERSVPPAIYSSLHRTCYSVAIGWIAFVCVFGYGGFINSVLSMKVLDPLFRISYFAYLLHYIVITYHVGIARERFYYSHVELVFRGFSYSCVTYILSFIFHILIEMPIKSIKCSLLSTTEQIVLSNYSSALTQVDILRPVQTIDDKTTGASFSPNGSNNITNY